MPAIQTNDVREMVTFFYRLVAAALAGSEMLSLVVRIDGQPGFGHGAGYVATPRS